MTPPSDGDGVSCDVVVRDAPGRIRLLVDGEADDAAVAVMTVAARVALEGGQRVEIDLSRAGPASVVLLRAVAALASVAGAGRLLLRRPDRTLRQFLRLRGLDRLVVA